MSQGFRRFRRNIARTCIGLLSPLAICLLPLRHGTAAQPPATQPATAPSGVLSLSPTRVTLRGKSMRVKDAFEDLGRQTGVVLGPLPGAWWERLSDRRISVDLVDQPFWVAMRELSTKTGITFGVDVYGKWYLRGDYPAWSKAPACVQGAAIVWPFDLADFRVTSAGPAGQTRADCTIRLEPMLEPRMRALYWKGLKIEQLTDESGAAIPLAARSDMAALDENAPDPGLAVEFEPRPGTRRVARMKGRVTAVVQTAAQSLEVKDISGARDVVKEVGGLRFVVNGRAGEVGYVVRYEVTRVPAAQGAGGADVPFQRISDWLQARWPRLLDADGRDYHYVSGGVHWEPTSCTAEFHFRGDIPGRLGKATRLVCEVPTATADLTVPFELTDLPLEMDRPQAQRPQAAAAEAEEPAAARPTSRPTDFGWAESEAAPAGPKQAEEIEALLARLGDTDWRARERAVRRLVEIGEPARAALRRAATREAPAGGPEARDRAAEALVRLDDPTRATDVSLYLDNVPAPDALAALAEKSGIVVNLPFEAQRRQFRDQAVTVHADHQPFWSVLLPLCAATGCKPSFSTPAGEIFIEVGTPGLPRVYAPQLAAVRGPVALAALTVHRCAWTEYGAERQKPAETKLLLSAYAEPKLQSPFWDELRLETCEGPAGEPIATSVEEMGRRFAGRFPTGTVVLYPPPGVTKIARIGGTAVFSVTARRESLNLADAVAGKEVEQVVKRVDGPMRVVVSAISKAGPQSFDLPVTVERSERDPRAWERLIARLTAARPEMSNSRGLPVGVKGEPEVADDGNRCRITWHFLDSTAEADDQPSTPAALTWNVPTDVKAIRLPFEMKDIPLP